MSGAVFFLYLQKTLLFCVRPCKSLFLVNLKRLDIGPNAFMVCMIRWLHGKTEQSRSKAQQLAWKAAKLKHWTQQK